MERERKQQGMTQVYFSKSGRRKKHLGIFFFSTACAKLLTSNLQVGTMIFKEKYLIKHD